MCTPFTEIEVNEHEAHKEYTFFLIETMNKYI